MDHMRLVNVGVVQFEIRRTLQTCPGNRHLDVVVSSRHAMPGEIDGSLKDPMHTSMEHFGTSQAPVRVQKREDYTGSFGPRASLCVHVCLPRDALQLPWKVKLPWPDGKDRGFSWHWFDKVLSMVLCIYPLLAVWESTLGVSSVPMTMSLSYYIPHVGNERDSQEQTL